MAVHFTKTGERGHFRSTCPSLHRANDLQRELFTTQIPPGVWCAAKWCANCSPLVAVQSCARRHVFYEADGEPMPAGNPYSATRPLIVLAESSTFASAVNRRHVMRSAP
eukprot:8220075-Lingulodinium_polyedra.AAC.1